MYRILICPNAYKGSLTAAHAATAIDAGLHRAAQSLAGGCSWLHDFQTDLLPLADGGDGTLETLVAATDGEISTCRVHDPLGRLIDAPWGRLGGARSDTGVIEMARASGLALLRLEERDPRRASTYGTGELIQAALDAGCRKLIIGIGGSATNDGGAGMATALGVRLLDSAGSVLEEGGAALAQLARIDLSQLRPTPDIEIIVASDVDNPLCGPQGASAIYGPQKGAAPEVVAELDAALQHYAQVLHAQVGMDVVSVPGAGAAGGLGAGLMAFLGAKLQSGLEIAMEATGFDARLRECRLAITGEGRLDSQTARGKVVAGVARHARAAGVPAVALAGSIEERSEAALREQGLAAALSIVDRPMSIEEAMKDASSLLSYAAERLLRILAISSAS